MPFFKTAWSSPLRYPGGKSRLVDRILKHIPQQVTTLCAPFIGGGSIELACAARGMNVMAYDGFEPLVNFWQMWLNYPLELAQRVQHYYPLTRHQFYALQKGYFAYRDTLQQAAIFFVLNRASFSGMTFQGGMSLGHPRFTQRSIDALMQPPSPDQFSVQHADVYDSLSHHANDFSYLDPPYYLAQKLYGNTGETQIQFDHEGLAKWLQKRGRWLLSYNDCAFVRQRYADCTIQTIPCQYSLKKPQATQELLILSPDLATAGGTFRAGS